MATTTNWGIVYPVVGNIMTPLATQFANLANSTETALNTGFAKVGRTFASAAARNAVFTSPVQGDRVFRSDLGHEETYFGLYNAGTNPNGASVAGWYATGGVMPYVKLVASAQQSIGPGGAFTNWVAPGTGSISTIVGGSDYFTYSGGTVTITKPGIYDVRTHLLLQVGAGVVVHSVRLNPAGTNTVLSQSYVSLSSSYGTSADQDVKNFPAAAGDILGIVDDVGGPLFWATGANGTNLNSGFMTIQFVGPRNV